MSDYREKKAELKDIIIRHLNGEDFHQVKRDFQSKFSRVKIQDIEQMERELDQEGINTKNLKLLYNTHAEVYEGRDQETYEVVRKFNETPGHPIHTFFLENRELERLVDRLEEILASISDSPNEEEILELQADVNLLWDIDKHYSRKENLLFPYLEQHGVVRPTSVMWAHDDDVRVIIKTVNRSLRSGDYLMSNIQQYMKKAIEMIRDMIYKEENILLPSATRLLSEEDWFKIAEESGEIGYCIASPEARWIPDSVKGTDQEAAKTADGFIKLETGILTVEELEGIFRHLPIDVTFVDKDDTVKFFSHSPERIFVRTKAIIGRNVTNCHPPASVHVVEDIVNDFKTGKKDSEDFWIPLGDMFVLIRYFAVRDAEGNYMGTIETTQNIKPLQEITGSKRLMSSEDK